MVIGGENSKSVVIIALTILNLKLDWVLFFFLRCLSVKFRYSNLVLLDSTNIKELDLHIFPSECEHLKNTFCSFKKKY